MNHLNIRDFIFLTMSVGAIQTESLKFELRIRISSTLCNFCAVLSFPTAQEKLFFVFSSSLFLLVVGQIHCVSIFQPLQLPLSNSGLMIVILKQSELSNQKQQWWMPRCSLCLFVLGWRGAGARIEFYAYLFRCIFLTAAALLYSSRQHWLNGNSSVIWIKRGETWGR